MQARIVYNYGQKLEVGDLNGDGYVNSIDSNYLKRIFVGKITIVDMGVDFSVADIDGDGDITSMDSYYLGKKIAGTY